MYQNVPEFVSRALGYSEKIDEQWRGDTARYRYLVSNWISPDNRSSMSARTRASSLSVGAPDSDARITAVEGNANHASFIRRLAELFQMTNVAVLSAYADAAGLLRLPECDTMLLLNILHHAGVDFDVGLVPEPQRMADYAVEYLRRVRTWAGLGRLPDGLSLGGQ